MTISGKGRWVGVVKGKIMYRVLLVSFTGRQHLGGCGLGGDSIKMLRGMGLSGVWIEFT
jgi:hypothetical protein